MILSKPTVHCSLASNYSGLNEIMQCLVLLISQIVASNTTSNWCSMIFKFEFHPNDVIKTIIA